MTAFGKANYEGYREFNHGVSAVTGEPLPVWDKLPVHIQSGWSAGADAVALVLAECPVDEDAPGSEPTPIERYALVEQMGHRATTGTVREVTFLGEPMLEVTDLLNGSVHLVSPKSLYEVSWLTEAEARQQVKPWTATAIGAAPPRGWDDTPYDADPDEGKDDGMTAAERDQYDRDAEFRLDAADEARDLEREAEAEA